MTNKVVLSLKATWAIWYFYVLFCVLYFFFFLKKAFCTDRFLLSARNDRYSLVRPIQPFFFPVRNKGVFVPVYWPVRYRIDFLAVKLREEGKKSEQLRKKERQIEKEIEAIDHGWLDLEAAAAEMRSVMGGGDEIVSRRSDLNRGCMHDCRAVGWGWRFRPH